LVTQWLRIISERVADTAGNRDGEHDQEGKSEMAGEDAVGQAIFISVLFGLAVV
jgi:hypothetical protein